MSLRFSALSTECKKHLPQLKGLAFFLILAAYLTALWWFEGAETSTLLGRSAAIKAVKYFGDAAAIVFPFALLKPRFRWAVFIPVWVISLWVIGAIWYFRFWGELPGISALFLFSNVGRELIYSVLALWRPADLLFLLLPLALNLIYRRRKSLMKFSLELPAKLTLGLFTVAAFTLGQCVSSVAIMRYNNSINNRMTFAHTTRHRLSVDISSNSDDLTNNGPIVHFLKSCGDALKILSIKKELTEGDKAAIENFISSTPPFPAIADSIIARNREKNIIFIIVESLNGNAIFRQIQSRPVAPTLSALVNSEGTVSALNMVTQVRAGGSGDGQLIANTGLHPLSIFSTSIALGSSNAFPSLPRILGKEDNAVIFTDDAKSWNEFQTFTSFGFAPVYSRLDYPELIDLHGGDGAMFNFASAIIPRLRQPFFLELLTASMHTPFNDLSIPAEKLPQLPAEGAGEEDSVELNYLRMLNYFDRELGLFIERLKADGVFDDTILIIASDHSERASANDSAEPAPMALIIANCGITAKIDRTVGQVDIFPTILNFTGNVGPKNYRGAGTSILTPELNADSITVRRLQEAQTVSELILRTDYFAD
ncbi:MAG: LTA synthase family protein [Bacteroides sp.]|nr:LTA synthase family protein [Bacteroides sp.]